MFYVGLLDNMEIMKAAAGVFLAENVPFSQITEQTEQVLTRFHWFVSI